MPTWSCARQGLASQTRFDDALQAAQSAQRAAPRLPEFQSSLALYQSARTLAASLTTSDDLNALRPTIERLRTADRTAFTPVEVGLVRVLTDRLNRVGARDPAAAMQLRTSVAPSFPGSNLPTFSPKRETPPAVVQAPRSSSPAAPAGPAATAPPAAEELPAASARGSTNDARGARGDDAGLDFGSAGADSDDDDRRAPPRLTMATVLPGASSPAPHHWRAWARIRARAAAMHSAAADAARNWW